MNLKTPDYLIIGAQKSGTTSLTSYLNEHDQIIPVSKEIHFFDHHYSKGIDWYKKHFISKKKKAFLQIRSMSPIVTGEGSPFYLYHPWVPERVHAHTPWVQLIVLLRDPVERAISHYFHEKKKGRETLPIREAFQKEEERLNADRDKFFTDPAYYSYNHHRFSYLDRGKYSEQLRRWFRFFPQEQFLILKSDTFFMDPYPQVQKVCDLLGLEPFPKKEFSIRNKGKKEEVPDQVRDELKRFFTPYNQDLYELCGIDFR